VAFLTGALRDPVTNQRFALYPEQKRFTLKR
jgi:hypothetical protein